MENYLIKDFDFLVEDLIDKNGINEKITSRTCRWWKCSSCDDKWVEPVTIRRRYKLCPKCTPRKIAINPRTAARECLYDGCGIQGTYNYPELPWGCACRAHKSPDMVDVKDRRRCLKCDKIPCYNFEEETKGIYCKGHSINGMVIVIGRKCLDCNKRQPGYNYPNEKEGLYCNTHKKEGMTHVHRKCLFCNKCPSFNEPDQRTARVCYDHKTETMINVNANLCKYCNTFASFGYPGKKPEACAKHKEIGMKGSHKTCELCDTAATFCLISDNKPIRCKEHCSLEMVPIKCRRCLKCTNLGSYNHPNDNDKYCKDHKEPEMINNRVRICEDKNCEKQASIGYPGNFPSRCREHSCEGMIYTPLKKCKKGGCSSFATYGRIKTLTKFCEEHKGEEDRSLIHKRCSLCNSIDTIDKEGLCWKCTANRSNFDERFCRELKVNKWLDNSEHDDYILHDKTPSLVKASNFHYRPDFLYDCESHYVILEVDEHMHNGRDKDEEMERMKNISRCMDMPIIFVRYNTDDYKIGKISISCDDEIRKKELFQYLDFCRNPDIIFPDKTFRIGYLFYNNYTKKQSFDLKTIDF